MVKTIGGVVRFLLKIWKPIIFIVGLALIVALTVLWVLSMIGYAFANPFAEYVLPESNWLSMVIITNLFFLAGLPILGLIRSCYRMLFSNTHQMKNWSGALITLWVINAFSFASAGGRIFQEYKMSASLSENISLNFSGDQLVLKSAATNDPYHDDLQLFNNFQFDDDKLVCKLTEIDILQSDGDQFELIQRNHSRGATISEARSLATELPVQVSYTDSVLQINPAFNIQKGSKFRGQTVRITLKVPKGKSVRINEDLSRLVHHIDLKDRHVHPWRWRNETWTMGDEGLVCNDCDGHAREEENVLSYSDFSKVNIDGKMKVTIDRGDQFAVRLSGKEAYTRKVEIQQMGNNLHISSPIKRPGSPIRIHLVMPQLDALSVENTDDVRINNFEQKFMSIRNHGDYDIKAFVNVDSLTVKQEGRNELDIRGMGKYLKADLIGRSKLDAEHYTVQTAVVNSDRYHNASAKMMVTDTLKRFGDIGSIRYDGDPIVVDPVRNH
ncbi:MAG: DUF2807 domain-containing protein [Bacteroidota bacterium]